MNRPANYRIELNGSPASVEDLRAVALVNYGHFTSMQVQGGCVRGLGLHLDRLERSTRELFGCPLDVDATRGWMRQIAGDDNAALSLRVNVFSRKLHRDHLAEPAEPDVLIAGGPVRAISAASLRVRSVRYDREAPHIKHVGTFGLFHQKRLAQTLGYDDALFVDAGGAVAEGTIWNIGFFDGERVVWPDAPALEGISMQLLKAGLRECGVDTITRRVPLGDVGTFRSAFFTNSSCTAVPIAAIDDVSFMVDAALAKTLHAAMSSQPLERI
ncbi:aminotransferase class IV family protein [Dokdonella soli]